MRPLSEIIGWPSYSWIQEYKKKQVSTIITHCRLTHGTVREEPQNNNKKDKQSKATSSLFPIKMIAKLELT